MKRGHDVLEIVLELFCRTIRLEVLFDIFLRGLGVDVVLVEPFYRAYVVTDVIWRR